MPQKLGLAAKIEPSADKSSTRKMKRELEQELEDVEELQFKDDGSFRGRTTPSANGPTGTGTGGGGFGGAGTGFAAGRLGSTGVGGGAGKAASRGLAGIGGGAALAGAGVAATVALGGVLANKMYDKMSQASGVLSASNSIWSQAMKLFWKPFGDALGEDLLPWAEAALDMATNFNEIYQSKGLKVAVGWLASSVADKLVPDLGGLDIPSPEETFSALKDFSWDTYVDVMEWGDKIGPMKWTRWIGELAWDVYVVGLDWTDWLNIMRWADFLTPMTDWSPFIDFLDDESIRDAIFAGVSIGKRDVLDWLFGDGGGGGGGGSGNVQPMSDVERQQARRRGIQRVTHTADVGGTTRSLDSGGTVTVKPVMDGKRLFEGVSREQEDLLRRV